MEVMFSKETPRVAYPAKVVGKTALVAFLVDDFDDAAQLRVGAVIR
jgi:hypothetical protein